MDFEEQKKMPEYSSKDKARIGGSRTIPSISSYMVLWLYQMNVEACIQDDSDSECDEQIIVVPSFLSNRFSGRKDPAASIFAGSAEPFPTAIAHVHADDPSLPPGHSLGSSEHSTRFPSPSDLANSISSSSEMEDIYHHPSTGIFSSSSYDADFSGTVTNLATIVAVDPVPTKRVTTIHPQSQILGDLTSPIQTRGTLKKSKFGESIFVSYVHDQQRNNHTDYLHLTLNYNFRCAIQKWGCYTKNLKNPSQALRGVSVGLKVGFKPAKEYRPVSKKPTASTSVTLVDDDGKPLEKVDYPGDYDSKDCGN
ncbi:hypothetical protein Tco_0110988 [Tanacetum coccineum]